VPPLSVLFLQTGVTSGFLMKRVHTKRAAYVAFSTFRDVLESLNGLALASRIKPSDCGSVSTSSWSQLYRTFRFLKLVDDRDVPTNVFKSLVTAKNQGPILRKLLKASYAKVFASNLAQMRPDQLDRILVTYGVNGATLQKARSFFLGAAVYSGIQLSPSLAKMVRHRLVRKDLSTGSKSTAQPGLEVSRPDLSYKRKAELSVDDVTVIAFYSRELTHDEQMELLGRLLHDLVLSEKPEGVVNTRDDKTYVFTDSDEEPVH
jgi:hypothetical protein